MSSRIDQVLQKIENRAVKYTVKAAARATGISESRLRTWERRYGIPKPARAASGRRLYDDDDLGVIRRMASLVSAGLSAAEAAEAARLGSVEPSPVSEQRTEHPLIAALVAAAESFDETALVAAMKSGTDDLGWAQALDEVVFPALKQIGRSWEEAAISPAKEHFVSELVKRELEAALHDLGPSEDVRPQIMLACPESERHDLGLMALALVLRQAHVNVVYLGGDVPTSDLIAAYDELRPHAVCLSTTSANGLASLVRASRTLVAARPVRLYVGGPAVNGTGPMAAGLPLPESLASASRLIVENSRLK